MTVNQNNQDNHGWSWSHSLHIIYHSRGCNICMEYGLYITEAKFVRDDKYVTVQRIRNEDSNYWQSRAIYAQKDLREASKYAKSLETRIRELKKELAYPHNYKDNRRGKRMRYNLPYEEESGMNSSAPRKWSPQPPPQPSTQEPLYTRVIQKPAPVDAQEDVQMEDRKVERFPPLLIPQPSLKVTRELGTVSQGANWRLAP
jgi:hypothetical protein